MPWKNRKLVAADLRRIYQAATAEEARRQLEEMILKWTGSPKVGQRDAPKHSRSRAGGLELTRESADVKKRKKRRGCTCPALLPIKLCRLHHFLHPFLHVFR